MNHNCFEVNWKIIWYSEARFTYVLFFYDESSFIASFNSDPRFLQPEQYKKCSLFKAKGRLVPKQSKRTTDSSSVLSIEYSSIVYTSEKLTKLNLDLIRAYPTIFQNVAGQMWSLELTRRRKSSAWTARRLERWETYSSKVTNKPRESMKGVALSVEEYVRRDIAKSCWMRSKECE